MDAQTLSGNQPGGNPPKPNGATIFPQTQLDNQPRKAGQTGNPTKPADVHKNGAEP
jgi:hypothetical protein